MASMGVSWLSGEVSPTTSPGEGERVATVLTDVIQCQVKEDPMSFEEAVHLVPGRDT